VSDGAVRRSDWAQWYATNLVGVPAPVLGGPDFNAHPRPLQVAGTRETNAGLFALLGRCGSEDETRVVFDHYMKLAFGLQPARGNASPSEARRWRTSYLKLLQGWGMDANGAAGAVLKGWVESRFGLVPSFHKGALGRFGSPAWIGYLEEKASARWRNNNIEQQLDLLYEFCQWTLARFGLPGADERGRVALWRGSNQCEEQVVEGSLRERHCRIRLNNIVSFSLSRDSADCFGDWVLKAWVPLSKLVLVPGLLPTRALEGEAEVLALGGIYEVEARYAA
jgi:NAD+--dinitrogen-reductase ADP-D-ribosyltransferase